MANRVALVSGAARGIGAAVAERLAADGWALSLGLRDPVRPDWARDLAGDHLHLSAYDAMAAGEEEWAAAALAHFGRIDALVASAGVIVGKDVIAVSDDELRAMIEVNVLAPRRLARAAWEALGQSGQGRVIILASLSGKRVKSARSGAYALTKFAAVALAHALRHEGFAQGIRATAVCPGLVATDMGRAVSDRAPELMTDPRDIARITALLLDLPNEASVAEFTVNCQLEESF